MARSNGSKTEQASPVEVAPLEESHDTKVDAKAITDESTELEVDPQAMDDSLNTLKTLLSAVEKLQKVRQEVGDIKPLLIRMLDGEVVLGEELEQLKTGVGGLFRLVRAYSDHQAALAKAQPARHILDQVLKETEKAAPKA